MRTIQMTEEMYPPVEGALDMIYGGIGSGKTTYATYLILKYARRGVKVFTSFPVNVALYDERRSLWSIVLGLFGFKRVYRRIDPSVVTYVPLEDFMSEDFLERLAEMTDCVVVVDEAYAARLFDSYRKTHLSVKARMMVYTTRHFNRRFIVVTQRPNAVHVSARAMVNRFYKCIHPFAFAQRILHTRFFVIIEYQDMIDESVNEEVPSRTRFKWYSNTVFNAFDSKYMRGNMGRKYPPPITDYEIGYVTRWVLLSRLFSRKVRLSAPPRSVSVYSALPVINSDTTSLT